MSDEALAPKTSWAFELALCLGAVLLYLLIAPALFAPIPILYLHQGNPNRTRARIWTLLSIPIGYAICNLIGGHLLAIGYIVFTSLPAIIIGEFLEHKKSPELAVSSSVLGICFAIFILLTVYTTSKHFSPWNYTKSVLSEEVRSVGQKILDGPQNIETYINNPKFALNKIPGILLISIIVQFGPNALDGSAETKMETTKIINNPELILDRIPGAFLTNILLLCILSLIVIIRWNPKSFLARTGISRDFLRRWQAPDWLIWPFIVCLGVFLIEKEPYTTIAYMALQLILAIYFFHGISILSYFLDLFRLRGFIRLLLYCFAVISPLMAAGMGIFDLWFDFRSRAR